MKISVRFQQIPRQPVKISEIIHGNTAAEVIVARADHTKEHMGLTSWWNAPNEKIMKADVSVAKNYLSIDKIHALNAIVSMYLDYATRQARRHISTTMADWASKLDAFLQFNNVETLSNNGKITAAIAKSFTESEFDRLIANTEDVQPKSDATHDLHDSI